MNKTIKKLTIAVVALSLVLLGVVGGVVAWLTAESGTVTNTFSYGSIALTLEETRDSITNTTGFAYTNVVPGDKLEKKAAVTVTDGSENCYVYILINNELNGSASLDIQANWKKVVEDGNWVLYRYTDSEITDANMDTPLTIFEYLTFKNELTKANLDALETASAEVVVWAYAHQAEHVEKADADKAAQKWAITKGATWADPTP